MEKAWLDLILRLKKEGKGPEEVEKALKKVEGQTKKTGTAADQMKKAFGAAFGAVTVGMIFKTGVELFKLAEEAELAERALEGFAGSSYEAEKVLDAVREGASGTLDKMTAMQMGAKLLSMGLAKTAEEAGNLTEIAVTLGASMGKGPQQAFEDFTLLLANQSILRLDTFGISGAVVRQRMAELADEMVGADRQTLFLTATMEEANKKLGQLEQAGFDAGTSTQRLSAAFADLKLNLGESLAVEMRGPMAELARWAEFQMERAEFMERHGLRRIPFTNILKNEAGVVAWTTDEYLGLVEAEKQTREELEGLSYAGPAFETAMRNLKKATGEFGDEAEEAEGKARTFLEILRELAGMTGTYDYSIHIGIPGGKARALKAAVQEATKYTKYAPHWQHGGSFTIQGPPGPDRVPVMFMGTAGEEVDITPRQNAGRRERRERAQVIFQPGSVVINDKMGLEEFQSMLKQTLR